MREAAFVKQNKDKWATFEKALENPSSLSADALADLYVEITDHLAYAQTFYPNSKTSTFLNGLAQVAHQKILSLIHI